MHCLLAQTRPAILFRQSKLSPRYGPLSLILYKQFRTGLKENFYFINLNDRQNDADTECGMVYELIFSKIASQAVFCGMRWINPQQLRHILVVFLFRRFRFSDSEC